MLLKMILNSIRTAIAIATAKTVGDAVEAGVAKGLQDGLARSLGEGLTLPSDLDQQLNATIDRVPQLCSAEQQAERVLLADQEKPTTKRSSRRKAG